MKESDNLQKSLSNDIAIKIAALLQVCDLCSLGRCSKFWREFCKSDCLWESLAKQRWPSLGLVEASSSSSSSSTVTENPLFQGWRAFYVERHVEAEGKAMEMVSFVERALSASGSIEAADYLRTIENLHAMKPGFKDVEILLFKPKLNPLLNLVGVHYCLSWLKVPGGDIQEALGRHDILERQVVIKWWKLGRWFYGFRMKDESCSRLVSLGDLATSDEEEVLRVLFRGAVHEVLRVQISNLGPSVASWYSQSSQIQG